MTTTTEVESSFDSDPALTKYRNETHDLELELEVLREEFAECKRISDEDGRDRAYREIRRLQKRADDLAGHIRRRLVDLGN